MGGGRVSHHFAGDYDAGIGGAYDGDVAENKTVGWWLGWVLTPALVVGGGAVVAATSGTTGGVAAGTGAAVATAFVLWRRFWS